MAILYCWSGAAGSGSGADWTNAKTTLTAAFTTEVAGDTIYVAHDHAESTGAAVTLASSGTAILPTKIICVNRAGSVPPVSADRRATAQVTVTGAFNLIFNTGCAHYDGIIFTAGTATNASSIYAPNTAAMWVRFDNCSLRLAGSNVLNNIYFGNQGNSAGTYVELNNTTVSFANAGSGINVAAILRWRNTASAVLGTAPTTHLFFGTASRGGLVECIGVDLSAVSATLVGTAASSTVSNAFKFIDCKLHASVTKSAAIPAPGSHMVDLVRSGAAGNYTVHRQRYAGTLTEETSIVRTSGATDGTTPISWKAATSANCNYSAPFECPPIAIWCDTTGVSKTATIEGIWVGAVPFDDEVWLDVGYLSDASSPISSSVNDGKANLMATAAAQTSSSETWGGLSSDVGWSQSVWELATVTAVTLSGGDLVATNTGTSSVDQGARVASAAGKTSGKYYFECTTTTYAGGPNHGFGIGTTSSNYTGMGPLATTGSTVHRNGVIYSNGAAAGPSIGSRSDGDVIGVAVDLDNRMIWFKRVSSPFTGGWNSSTANANDPATNVGGVSVPAGTMVPFCTFGGSAGGAGNVITANFGTTPFVGVVPTGFGPNARFKFDVTFTPQQKGWVYARVKCARASSTFYIDPLVTLT